MVGSSRGGETSICMCINVYNYLILRLNLLRLKALIQRIGVMEVLVTQTMQVSKYENKKDKQDLRQGL